MYNQIHFQRCHFTNKGKIRGDVHEGSSCLALSLSTVFQVASCQFWQGCVCCTTEAPAVVRPRTSSRLCHSPTFQQVQTPNKLSTASRRALAWVGEQAGRGCGMGNLAKDSGRRRAGGKARQGAGCCARLGRAVGGSCTADAEAQQRGQCPTKVFRLSGWVYGRLRLLSGRRWSATPVGRRVRSKQQ